MNKILSLFGAALLCASLAWGQSSPALQTGSESAPATSTTSASNPGTVQGCLSGSDGNYVLTQDNTGTAFKLMGSEDQLKSHVGHEVQVTGQISAAAVSSGQDQNGMSTSPGTSAMSSSFQVSDVKMVSDQCNSASENVLPSASAAPTSGETAATPVDAAPMTGTSDTSSTTATPAESNSTENSSVASSGTMTGNTAAASSDATATSQAAGQSSVNTSAMNSAPPAASNETVPSSQASPASSSSSAEAQNQMPATTTSDQNTAAAMRQDNALPRTASNLPLIGLIGVGFLAAGLLSARRRRTRRGQSILG